MMTLINPNKSKVLFMIHFETRMTTTWNFGTLALLSDC